MEQQVMQSIQTSLFGYFMDEPMFTTKDAYKAVEQVGIKCNKESIRARIYEAIDMGYFEKISRGVYKVVKKVEDDETLCLLVNGNGRDLSMVQDNSVDCILTDHPYEISKQLQGGNRCFASYDSFRYTEEDFKAKAAKLKEGGFLIEFLPAESEANYEYLYSIKQMAKQNNLKYYCKVPWIKGNFVSNCGRSAKNTEDILFLSKGEPRTLKLDTKKNIAEANQNGLNPHGLNSEELKELLLKNNLPVHYMKGANGMLPTAFNFQPKAVKDKVMEAEKPVELLEAILDYVTLPGEIVLDQFAGSHNLVLAGLNKHRRIITFEKSKKIFDKAASYITQNINAIYAMGDTL